MDFPSVSICECEICFENEKCFQCPFCKKQFCKQCYQKANDYQETKVFSCPDCKEKLPKIYQYLILGRDCTKYVEHQIDKYKQIIELNKHYEHDFMIEFKKEHPKEFEWIKNNKSLFLNKIRILLNVSKYQHRHIINYRNLIDEIKYLFNKDYTFKGFWIQNTEIDINIFSNIDNFSLDLKFELFEILNNMLESMPELITNDNVRTLYNYLNYELYNEHIISDLKDEIKFLIDFINYEDYENIDNEYSFIIELFHRYSGIFRENEFELLILKSILHVDNTGELINVWFPKIRTTFTLNNNRIVEHKPKLQYCSKSILLDKEKRKNDISKLMKLKKYSNSCPNEKCVEGYLIEKSEFFECDKCSIRYCKKCKQPISENHKCKEEDLETIRCIQEISRECPCCGVMVQKSHGCNHMFCTICHTGFCYRTGRVLKDSEQTNTLFTEWRNAQENKGIKHQDRLSLNQMILYGEELRISRQAISFYEKAIIELSSMYKNLESKRLRMVNMFCDNQDKILRFHEEPTEIINLFHHLNLSSILMKFMIYSFSEYINSDGKGSYYKEKLNYIKETILIIEKLVEQCLL